MQVRDGMSTVVLTVGPSHSLQEAARLMAERNVGAAVVVDPESPGPGILTERDILRACALTRQSLEVLSVLHQLVGLHRSGADLRSTPAVQVLP